MANMSYCRFRNTLEDLRDCYSSMCEHSDPESEVSEEEATAMRRLVKLCAEIAGDFELMLPPEAPNPER